MRIAILGTAVASLPSLFIQSREAEVIVCGIVKEHKTTFEEGLGLTLAHTVFYKGLGPYRIGIKGFSPGGCPGTRRPAVGSSVCAFGCKSGDKTFPLQIMDFVSGAGIISYTAEVKRYLKRMYGKNPHFWRIIGRNKHNKHLTSLARPYKQRASEEREN